MFQLLYTVRSSKSLRLVRLPEVSSYSPCARARLRLFLCRLHRSEFLFFISTVANWKRTVEARIIEADGELSTLPVSLLFKATYARARVGGFNP